jgi:hypothetical protein
MSDDYEKELNFLIDNIHILKYLSGDSLMGLSAICDQQGLIIEETKTAGELAEHFRVNKSTITRMAAMGDIPALPLGTGNDRMTYRFYLSEVIEALEKIRDKRSRSIGNVGRQNR